MPKKNRPNRGFPQLSVATSILHHFGGDGYSMIYAAYAQQGEFDHLNGTSSRQLLKSRDPDDAKEVDAHAYLSCIC